MDGEELLPTKHENVFMVENHRLDMSGFQRDFEVLKELDLVRNREGAVALLMTISSRY